MIKNCVVGENAIIEAGANLENAIIGVGVKTLPGIFI